MPNHAKRIAHEMTVFGNAITAIYSVYLNGTGDIEPWMELPSKLDDDPIPLAGAVSAESAKGNDVMLRALSNELGGRLLVSVWDIIRYTEIEDEPICEFLRYIRNGVAHDNLFDFERREPKNPKWRDHELTTEMQDEPVMTTVGASNLFMKDSKMIEGFFEAGDAKELSKDILLLAQRRAPLESKE